MTSKIRFLWTLAAISTFCLSLSPQSQAADFTSPYLPELKSMTIESVDETENWSYGPIMTITFTVRIHRNSFKEIFLSFGSSNAVSNPLSTPCVTNFSFRDSSFENLSSVSDGDWRIETLRYKMINSGGLVRTACAGTYRLSQITIYDLASRQLNIQNTVQTSLFWEALGETSPYLPCKTTWVGAPAWSRINCNQTLNWDSYKFDITQASLTEPKPTKAEIKAKQEAEAKAAADKAAAELKAKQEADAKAAAELKAKQEADAKAAAELKAKQEAEAAAKAAAELKAKQEAEAAAKAAAELKAKQEAEAAAKAAAELKAKQEADAKVAAELKVKQDAAADKAALAKAQSELATANAALADSQKVNRELQTQLNSVEAQFKILSDSVSLIQGQVSQLNSKLAAALAGQNALTAKLKKVCSAKPKPKGC